MANHSKAQRYNNMMDEIFKRSNDLGHTSLHGSKENAKGRAMDKKHEAKTKALGKLKYHTVKHGEGHMTMLGS